MVVSRTRWSSKRASRRRRRYVADPFPDALVAVRDGRFGDALAALLAGWQHEPSSELRGLIELLSAEVSVMAAPELHGRGATAQAAWLRRAGEASASDVPALVATLTEASSRDAAARLDALVEWLPDPRIDRVMVGWLETVPYRATMTRPFWRKAFAALRELRDRELVPRLEDADAAIASSVAPAMASWLRGELAKVLAELRGKLIVAAAPTPPILVEIAHAFVARRAAAASAQPRAELADLLAAVYADPDDDGARLVYADALLERGDPRGELIALQCRLAHAPDSPDAKQLRRRIRELLDSHGKLWLGELAPIVRSGYRFERGFLAACRIDPARADRVRALVGHPAWATVRELGGSAAIALHPVMRSLRTLAFDAAHAAQHEKLPDAWRDLLVATPRPLRELRYAGLTSTRTWDAGAIVPGAPGRWVDVPSTGELAALCAAAALPGLRSLAVAAQPELVVAPLLAAPVRERLDALTFVFEARGERAPLRWFADALATAPVATLAFELAHSSFHPTELRLERDTAGAYQRATLLVGPTSRSNWSETLVDEAIVLLDALPRTVRRLHVTARRHTDPRQLARLRAAVEQLALDSWQLE